MLFTPTMCFTPYSKQTFLPNCFFSIEQFLCWKFFILSLFWNYWLCLRARSKYVHILRALLVYGSLCILVSRQYCCNTNFLLLRKLSIKNWKKLLNHGVTKKFKLIHISEQTVGLQHLSREVFILNIKGSD